MDCRPHSVAFRKVLLLLCALLATWVTPSRGTTTKYPQALELCHSRSTSWVLCPIGPTMRVVTQSSEIAGFVQATRQLLLQRRTQDRLQVSGRGHPQARLKVRIHRCPQARFQVHRYSQAKLTVRTHRCPRLKAYKCLRLQALTHRCTQTGIQLHRCPQAWLKAYRCPQTRLQLRTHRCTQTRLQLHRYLQVPASSAPDARVPAGYLHTASQLQGRPGPKSGVSSRPKNLPYCSHACLDSWCEDSSSVRWSWVKQHACSHCFTASAEAKRRSGYLSGSRVLFTLCVHCQKIDACVPQVAVV